MSEFIKVVAFLKVRPEKYDLLFELLNSMIVPTRAEEGNLQYDLWQDKADLNCFVLDELYKSRKDVAFHRETPYFKRYTSAIDALAE